MERGAVVGSRFEVEGLARAGGMGSVFRARDRESGEYVAIKVARPEAMHYAERFAREAAVLSELRHPGIVRYIAHGHTDDGDMYLAMEWLEGEDLGQRLAGEGLSIADSVTLIRCVAETLSAAHRRGIVHRDLKPSNLFLPSGAIDRVKVLDFGIVRVTTDDDRSTQTGTVLGTIGYMAPEQARGSHEVDPRADVFALGCVLFECLTGRPAFSGRDVLAVQAKILLEEAPRVDELRPDVPLPIVDVVARMLAKDPKGRPKDAAAVARELSAIERGETELRARTHRPPALTGGEQRLLCVAMLAPTRTVPANDSAAPTLASDVHGGSVMALREAARAYGGRLEALANGSVVVTLESLTSGRDGGAATDLAARAARCALALRAIVRDVPIALATGRGDATSRWPVGEVIDRAVSVLRLAEARLPEADRPIELDELTAGLLDARFEVHSERGRCYLRGQREAHGPARTLLGRPTPFVGRTRELGTLEAIFDECVGEGIAQAVLVEGPPGVGKSRLSWELTRKLLSRGEKIEVWIGRGDPMSVGAPFAMITEAVRRGLGLEEGEPLAVHQAKLRARLARHFVARELERVLEFLGELLSVPSASEPSVQLRAARKDPILMGDQMRRAFEDWLAAECATHPVVLVLEDLHWGDLPTVQFVDGALRHLEGRPLMVLALARPDVHVMFPTLWSDRKVTRMTLSELTRKASERLVRYALGEELADDQVARLVERSAGNAFYLEEIIRAAAEARDAEEGPPSELPRTVLAMVQARLEALPTDARRVLRAASVFGQVFRCEGVRSLLGDRTLAEVARNLDELVHREILVRREHEGEYAFRHAYVRDAAYAMLVDRDRALGHLLAAEFLESSADPDEHAVALAEHFERGGARERAARWFRRAAEQALEGNDFRAVIDRSARGIACSGRLEELGPLRLLQAQGYRWCGQLAEAESHALDALNSLLEEDPLWYEAAGELAVAASLRGSNERLVEVGDLLRAVPLRTNMLAAQIVAWSRAATWLVLLGFAELGATLIVRIEEAATLLEEHDPGVLARVRYTQATRALVAGDTAEYLLLSEAAAAEFELSGIVRSLAVQRRNAGIARVQLGLDAEAEQAFRPLLEQARRLNIGSLIAEVQHWLAIALARQGRLDEARAAAEASVSEALAKGARWIEARARASLAQILSLREDPSAEEEAQRALAVAGSAPAVRACALATLAEIRLRTSPNEALAAAAEAVSLLSTLGGIEEGEGLARLVYAEALQATGDLEGARRAISEAKERLLARADRIKDEDMRRSFLARVPEHARTLELHEQLFTS